MAKSQRKMKSAITASDLRRDVYRLLDKVVKTGRPLYVERKGQVLSIVPDPPKSKLDSLVKHDTMRGNPEDFVHCDWSHEWKPYL